MNTTVFRMRSKRIFRKNIKKSAKNAFFIIFDIDKFEKNR